MSTGNFTLGGTPITGLYTPFGNIQYGAGLNSMVTGLDIAALSKPTFSAPLTNSLALSIGVGLPTFTRATAATQQDFEKYNQVLSGEARFQGMRRVRNLVISSENLLAGWVPVATGTIPTATIISFGGSNSYVYQTFTNYGGSKQYRVRFTASGTPGNTLNIFFGDVVTLTKGGGLQIVLTATDTDYSFIVTSSATIENYEIEFSNRNFYGLGSATAVQTFKSTKIQVEDVTGQSNQNPSEYQSVGVLAFPYQGAGVDGVQYFPYLNGNTVTNNVVTAGTGAPIPAATLEGYLDEPAATNFFLNSGAPATQTTGSLGVGTYCCWVNGAGSIAIAGGTATITGGGSATAATPLVFNVTVAGTVVCTYTATLTFVQLENNPFPTSEIDTAGATVTRNADLLTHPTAGNILAAQGSLYFELVPTHAAGLTVIYWGSFVDANNYAQVYHNGTQLIFYCVVGGVAHSAVIANSYVAGTKYKILASWGTSGKTITVSGVEGTPDADTTALQLAANMQFGGSAALTFEGAINASNLRIWQQQLPAATRLALTT